MAKARVRLAPHGRAIGPARVGQLGRIPLPDVLLGDANQTGWWNFHPTEQDGAAALAVPDHGRVISGTGCGDRRELAPLAGGGIPFPGISKRAGTGRIDAAVDSNSGEGASEEQHLAGGLLEHHAVLAAGVRWRTLARAVGEIAASRLPFPGVLVVAVGGLTGLRAATEDDEFVASRVKDHACARARARLARHGPGRIPVGPGAGRGIPLPQVLGRRQRLSNKGHAAEIVPLSAEHDQHLAGLVKNSRLQKARVGALRGGGNERPGGDFARRHDAQGRVGRLHSRVRPVCGVVFVAGGE